MAQMLATGRAGRPKDPAKRAAIVAAAMDLLGAQRYEAVTMEAVAARAGVSKMTVYSHFSDKETLFEAVVRRIADRLLAVPVPQGEAATSLAARLEAIGVALMQVVAGCDAPGEMDQLWPMLRANQALALRYYEAGPGRVRAAVAAIVAEGAARGELVADSAEQAADDLIGLWEGGLPARRAFGLVDVIPPAAIAQRVRHGTALFMRLYGRLHGAVAAAS